MHSLLAVRLKAQADANASVTSFGAEIDCLLDIVDEKYCHTIDTFRELRCFSREVKLHCPTNDYRRLAIY